MSETMEDALKSLERAQQDLEWKLNRLDNSNKLVRKDFYSLDSKALERKELRTSSLCTKWVFDVALLGLALGAIANADAEKTFVRRCECGSSSIGETNNTIVQSDTDCSSCESLNIYRFLVFGGSLLFLMPAMTSSVDFSFVTKKSMIDDNNVIYHLGGDKLFRSMFSLMYYEYGYYGAFVFRVPRTFFNWLLLLIVVPCYPCDQSTMKRLSHFAVSLPGHLMPPVLVLLLFVLVRDADNSSECFSYAAALQVFAHLGNWLIGQILHRDKSVGQLVGPFTYQPDSKEQILDHISTQLGRASTGISKWAEIVFPNTYGFRNFDQKTFLKILIQSLGHFPDVRHLSLHHYRFDSVAAVEGLERLKIALPPGAKVRLDRDLPKLPEETMLKLAFIEV